MGYTGRYCYAEITHILKDTDFPQGLQPGYCLLSLSREQGWVMELDGYDEAKIAGELKIGNPPFDDLYKGSKTADLRNYVDRNFEVGQIWRFMEYEL